MILMLAPSSNMMFGLMPSGLTYVSDQYGLVKIPNDSVADQTALMDAGCFTLTPFGGWGTFGFNLLSDLYAADTGAILPGITGYPQHTIANVFSDPTSSNIGAWAKTGAGSGAGNWTQISTLTLAGLNASLAATNASVTTEAAARVAADAYLQSEIAALQSSLHLAASGPVSAATTGSLPANTYNNGTSGVGATLTGNANGALAAQDGVTVAAGARLLVKNEAASANNGVYVVTQAGSASSPYILTRATDANTPAQLSGVTVMVSGGTTQAGMMFVLPAPQSLTIGTTALAFVASTISISGAPPVANYAALRALHGNTIAQVYVTQNGIAGAFVVNPLDTTSADNGGTIIVDASGNRWCRVYDGGVNVRWFGAKGDGVTNDTAAINAAAAYCSANSLSLYFPGGHRFGCTNLIPYSNVDYFGDGADSVLFLIENATNNAHIFYSAGLDRSTYYQRNWKPLNSVSPGYTVALTNSGDAANFSVGQLVVVTSTGHYSSGGSDVQPYYAFINKIIGISGSTITFESPILDSISGAQIAKQNDFTSGSNVDNWCGNSTFRNLCFDLSSAPAGIQAVAFSTNALYRCWLHDLIYISPYAVLAVNGLCHSTVEDIIAYDMRNDSANTLRLLEIKTGSYASRIKNIFASTGAIFTASTTAFIEPGEYAHHIWIDGVRFEAPGVTNSSPYTVGPSGSIGNDYMFKGIKLNLAGCGAFLSTNGQNDPNFPNYAGHVYLDCEINSPACAETLRIIPNVSGSATFKIDGVRALQPNSGIAIGFGDFNGFVGCMINDVQSDGVIQFAPSGPLSYATDIVVSNCMVAGIQNARTTNQASYAQPWQIPMYNIRRFREASVTSAATFETGVDAGFNSTTAQTVAQASFPAFSSTFGWCLGDAIEFDIEFLFLGANNTKTVSLVDVGNSNTPIVSIAATATGNYRMRGELKYFQPGYYSGMIVTDVNGGSPTVSRVAQTNSGILSFNFQLTALVANAADSIQFTKYRITPRLMFGSGSRQ